LKAIILVGGQGLRLREVIADVPKPMAPVAGRPFLEYLVLQLKRYGIGEIVLATGYKSEVVKACFGDGSRWAMRIDYSEEQEPLGTGGALKIAATMVDDDSFLLMNGDSFLDVDLDGLIGFHRDHSAVATLSLIKKEDAGRYGSVIVDNNGVIQSFTEKGIVSAGLINGGVYCLDRGIVRHIGDGTISLERDVLPGLTGNGLYGMITGGFFKDIGIPADYRDICDDTQPLLRAVGL
jgi:D-glycero-alpha-D-manno-heptose 1-phosphate guanylyltransferase